MKKTFMILVVSAIFALMGFSTLAFADTVIPTDSTIVPDPAAYVTVDAGTAFELTLDAENLVIGIEALEDAGTAVLDGVDLTGQPAEEAISQLIEEAVETGVLPTDGTVPVDVTVVTEEPAVTVEPVVSVEPVPAEEPVITGTVPDTGTAVTEETLVDAITDALEELEVPVVVTYQNAAVERIALAKTLGITPGKLNLIQKYAATTEDPAAVVLTDWTAKPVKEIMKAIKDSRKAPVVTTAPAGSDETVAPVTETTATATLTAEVNTDTAPVKAPTVTKDSPKEKDSSAGKSDSKSGSKGGSKGGKNK